MFTSYPGKLLENAKDLLTRPSVEQTAKDKETTVDSLQDKLATQQEKADHPALFAVEKNKKYRIPFVALALAVVLACISMVGPRSVALADKLTPSTPTYLSVNSCNICSQISGDKTTLAIAQTGTVTSGAIAAGAAAMNIV